jgi:H+-transporting ATPase
MVTGDALAIAQETAKKLGLGTNILDAGGLGDSKRKETKAVAASIEHADGFAQVFPSTSSTSSTSSRSTATSSG